MQVITPLLPYLQFIAGASSGWLASWLFDQLRDDWLTQPTWPVWAAHALDSAVYRPMGARISVFVLSAAVAVLVSLGVAAITAQPAFGLVDSTLLAIVLGQIRHGVKTFPLTVDVELEGDDDARDSNP